MKRIFAVVAAACLLIMGVCTGCGPQTSSSGSSDSPEQKTESPDAVVVDYGKKVSTASPYVFGFNNNGDGQTYKKVQAEFDKIGITWIRKSIWFEQMLPLSVVPSIKAWKNNENDCKNPDNWASNHFNSLSAAKKSGDKIMLIICYTPPFLSYNGEWNGVPKDWDVFEEMIRITIKEYKEFADIYEIWNEYSAEYLDITGSPYQDKHAAYQDIYLHAAKAIREVVPDALIGGAATAMGGNISEMTHLLENPAFTPESNLLNFVSYHEYANGDMTFVADSYRKLLTEKGFPKDMPIILDEWNAGRRAGTYHEREGIAFIGRTLISFMRANIWGAFYNSSAAKAPAGGFTEDHGIYEITEDNQVKFLPLINAFKVPGARLGLSKGDYDLMETSIGNTTDCLGIVNSEGQQTVFMANTTKNDLTTEVILKNIDYDGEPVVKAYTASSTDEANEGKTLTCTYGDKEIRTSVTLPAYGVVGIVVNDTYVYTPEVETKPTVPTVPTIVNPGFEEGYDGWSNSGTAVRNNAYAGSQCTAVGPTFSTEQVIFGLKPNSTYRLSAYVKNAKGGKGSLGVKEGGKPEVSTPCNGEKYQKVSVDFSTGPENKSAKIYIYNYSDKGMVYADDFTIETISENNPVNTDIGKDDKALIKNGGFEKGNADIYSGGVTAVKDNPYKGAYCGKLAAGQAASQTLSLKPNTEYEFTAYVKTDLDSDGGNKVSLVVKKYHDGEDLYHPVEFSREYKKASVTFKTGSAADGVEIMIWNATSGTAFVDDILLVEK